MRTDRSVMQLHHSLPFGIRRMLLLVIVLVAAALAPVAFLVVRVLTDDAGAEAVERVEGTAANGGIELAAPPASYGVTYRTEIVGIGVVEIEVVEGRPPFDVRVERRAGDELTALDIATLGALDVGAPDEERTALVTSPSVPERAAVLSGDLEAAVDAGLAEDLSRTATIAERPCRLVRLGGPTDGGALDEPTDDDHADVCVDERSLVLYEEWVRNGDVIRRKVATEVDVEPEVDDDAFRPLGGRLDEELGGGRVRRMSDESRFPDVEFFELEIAPAGFSHLGRYVVAADARTNATGVRPPRTVSLADVYTDGADLIVVENVGSTAGGQQVLPDDEGVPWVVDGFDGARAVFFAAQTELRALRPSGRAVRVLGTGDVDALTEVFEALVVRDGPADIAPYDEDVVDVIDAPA